MPIDAPSQAPHVLLFGAAHVDRVARSAPPFVPAASNPGECVDTVGGAAFNAGVALRKLGTRVSLVSARGAPPGSEIVLDALVRSGIEDAAITWLDRRTPTYTGVLDEQGELVAAVADMSVYDLLTPRVLGRRHIRDLIGGASALLLDANLPAGAIGWLVAEAGVRPVAAIGVSPAKVDRLAGVLSHLSALFVTGKEAGVLTSANTDDVAVLARSLAEQGARRAVVTDGPRACAVLDDGVVYLQEPPVVRAVANVTGAGDTLAAVAFHAFCDGYPFPQATRLGVAAASLHIARTPVDVDMPTAYRTIAAQMLPMHPIT